MKKPLTNTDISSIIDGDIICFSSKNKIINLAIDSRTITEPHTTLFFCLRGERNNGHDFIDELYHKGVINFVVEEKRDYRKYKNANFIKVNNALKAFQIVAAAHRKQFTLPIIGITGSNGKTIVKEWLHQVLHHEFKIVRSPKSYNSQVGVPLSLWQIEENHQLGIFEAGISKKGEMKNLQKMILPDIGVITNIGSAHDEGFSNTQEKIKEKLLLFKQSKVLIYNADHSLLQHEIKKAIASKSLKKNIVCMSWGSTNSAQLKIIDLKKQELQTHISLSYQDKLYRFFIPFLDQASIENVITVCSVAAYLKLLNENFIKRLITLSPIEMRMELKKGIHQCVLINDSYNADTYSLVSALEFLSQQSLNQTQTLILSDLLQTGISEKKLYQWVSQSLVEKKITRFIGIGKNLCLYKNFFLKNKKLQSSFFENTAHFLSQAKHSDFQKETILIKGARIFEFEKISRFLEEKKHDTVLEINLSALVRNLNQYHRILKKKVKIMAMVKAASYGAGNFEVAKILAYNRVDYLGVAYTDEGVALRNAGIQIPIMVMNTEVSHLSTLLSFRLEPVIFSIHQVKKIITSYYKLSETQPLSVHIELETGMHRLGFENTALPELAQLLQENPFMKVQSIFSHLAAAENSKEDEFTLQQIHAFSKMYALLIKKIGYSPKRHILNSAGIARFSEEAQFEMVRLGLGLYGIDSTKSKYLHLESVGQLKTIIAQIKKIKKGDSVGYNRAFKAPADQVIATINIGYADGLDRRLGNGKGQVFIGKNSAKIIGAICMDMTMIDITLLPHVKEGDEVIIFGAQQSVSQLASAAQTIPYEILTGVSSRVSRIYFQE